MWTQHFERSCDPWLKSHLAQGKCPGVNYLPTSCWGFPLTELNKKLVSMGAHWCSPHRPASQTQGQMERGGPKAHEKYLPQVDLSNAQI